MPKPRKMALITGFRTTKRTTNRMILNRSSIQSGYWLIYIYNPPCQTLSQTDCPERTTLLPTVIAGNEHRGMLNHKAVTLQKASGVVLFKAYSSEWQRSRRRSGREARSSLSRQAVSQTEMSAGWNQAFLTEL